MFIDALDKALGVSPDDPDASEARALSLERIVQASTAFCPEVDLTLCEFESIRRRGVAGDEALCTGNCTAADFVDIEARTCATLDDYPSDLLANRRYAGKSYEQRSCCKVGNDVPSDECPPSAEKGGSDSSIAIIIGVVAVVLVLVVGIVAFVCFRR